MARRRLKPVTPKKVIKSALYRMWLRSRERTMVLRTYGKECLDCGAPMECVHHIKPVDMDRIIDVIREELLTTEAMPLCTQCHKEIHARLNVVEEMRE